MQRSRDKMREDLALRGMSETTIRSYVGCARRFVEDFGRSPTTMAAQEIRAFLLHLTQRRVRPRTFNVYVAALGFLYRVKRGGERHVMLSARLLKVLRAHWKRSRPAGAYVFRGERADGLLSRRTVHHALVKAARRAGITKVISPHTLRHARAQFGRDHRVASQRRSRRW